MCTGSYTLWSRLLTACPVCVQRLRQGSLPLHKNRWQALQHGPTSRQNEGQAYPHRTSVRRRRSPCISLCNSPSETLRPICPRLQIVRVNHQLKEDKGYGPRFRHAPSQYHRWANPGGGTDFTYYGSTAPVLCISTRN